MRDFGGMNASFYDFANDIHSFEHLRIWIIGKNNTRIEFPVDKTKEENIMLATKRTISSIYYKLEKIITPFAP